MMQQLLGRLKVELERLTGELQLLKTMERHLAEEIDTAGLQGEADAMLVRLSAAAAADDATRDYVTRLEAMVDEARLPSGDDLISDIERFLREQGGSGSGGVELG